MHQHSTARDRSYDGERKHVHLHLSASQAQAGPCITSIYPGCLAALARRSTRSSGQTAAGHVARVVVIMLGSHEERQLPEFPVCRRMHAFNLQMDRPAGEGSSARSSTPGLASRAPG